MTHFVHRAYRGLNSSGVERWCSAPGSRFGWSAFGVVNVHPFDLGLRVATAHHVHGRTEEKDEPCTSGSGQDVDQSLPDHLWSQANQQPDGTRVGRYPSRRATAQRSGHPPESSTQPVRPPNEPGASSTFGGQPPGMVAEATARGPLRDLASLFSTSDGPRNQPVRQLRSPSREMTKRVPTARVDRPGAQLPRIPTREVTILELDQVERLISALDRGGGRCP
jgi:hypothetical protein